MAAVPIWKDKIVALATSTVDFRIVADGVVIYSGRAYVKPGDTYANARINEICADYLAHALPTLTDRTFTSFNLPSFVVQVKSGTSWVNQTTVQFYPDWSYDYSFSSENLSAPINGRVDSRMLILFSILNTASPLTANYRRTGGTTTARSISFSPTPGSGTGAFKVDALSGVERITIKSVNYYVVTDCAKFALYYVNAFGGWDQFLIEGNDMEVDDITRYIQEVEYDNNTISARGMVNFVNEVKKSWTLNSGLLDDDQASRMHHLLNSPLVYLCDIPTGEMIPVIMKTNTCEYKTFSNQGNRMVNYTMQVELAQNRIRR